MAEVVYKAQFDININRTGTSNNSSSDKDDKDGETLSKIKSLSNISTKKILNSSPVMSIVSLGAYATKKIANTLISNIGLSTGDTYMQESTQFQIDLVGGLISSVFGGMTAGSVIPGVGNIAGGLVGLGLFAFNTALNSFSAEYSAGIQKSIDKMNVGQIRLISGLGSSSFGRYSGSGELY